MIDGIDTPSPLVYEGDMHRLDVQSSSSSLSITSFVRHFPGHCGIICLYIVILYEDGLHVTGRLLPCRPRQPAISSAVVYESPAYAKPSKLDSRRPRLPTPFSPRRSRRKEHASCAPAHPLPTPAPATDSHTRSRLPHPLPTPAPAPDSRRRSWLPQTDRSTRCVSRETKRNPPGLPGGVFHVEQQDSLQRFFFAPFCCSFAFSCMEAIARSVQLIFFLPSLGATRTRGSSSCRLLMRYCWPMERRLNMK
jgi:hypothetical protein